MEMRKQLVLTVAVKLRKAIDDYGKSANEIAKATGVPQTTLSRFLRGEDMRLSAADKLIAFLGGEITFPPMIKVRVERPKPLGPRTVNVVISKSGKSQKRP